MNTCLYAILELMLNANKILYYLKMTNRVNAHLKRAHDLLKQSSKAFGAPRLSIRPIKQISIYLDGVSRQDYDEMMEKWEKNSKSTFRYFIKNCY